MGAQIGRTSRYVEQDDLIERDTRRLGCLGSGFRAFGDGNDESRFRLFDLVTQLADGKIGIGTAVKTPKSCYLFRRAGRNENFLPYDMMPPRVCTAHIMMG